MKERVLLLIFCFIWLKNFGQEKSFRYEKDFLSANFYQKNREELRLQLPDSSMAILFSAPVRNRANDTDYPFHQNPNLYYLTGYTEPNALLLIFKDPIDIG